MEESLFVQYVKKYLRPIAQRIVERINGEKKELTYRFQEMLTKRFSPTLTWKTLSKNGNMVAADIVSLDSSLPLKKRDSVSKIKGDIPKLGIKFKMNERQMQDVNILQATQNNEDELIRSLFEDTPKVITGVYERLEYMFHQGLSTGVALVSEDYTTGTGVRVDYGHPDSKKYGASVKWSSTDAKPVDDIERILDEAEDEGDSPQYIIMDRSTWNVFKTNEQVKSLHAGMLGLTTGTFPIPTLEQVNDALLTNYNVTLIVVNRSVSIEKNGVITKRKIWEPNKVSFIPSLNVGSLTYGTVAEELHPVGGVEYAKVDDYILVSKYRKNDPLAEFTSSQAFVLPVIDMIDEIYILDVEEAADDIQTEDDANFDYNGAVYARSGVISAINLADENANALDTNKDATLLKKINKLSDEQQEVFENNLPAPIV
ncbi:major capsid protein [Aquimarina sp. AU119]|uniref:major capsid protein n=1 Tax=Aquimarina sp. AU119 TaxID=2108528 RepID=UPI000D68ECC4|nr:major capsid protein [Aquimarina sp. AU119]